MEAVQSFQRAVELDPNHEQYYFDLGMEYLSHFTFGPAGEVYRVGTQKFPRYSRQFLGLAFSHYAVREYAEAADAFTTALEIDPESPVVFLAGPGRRSLVSWRPKTGTDYCPDWTGWPLRIRRMLNSPLVMVLRCFALRFPRDRRAPSIGRRLFSRSPYVFSQTFRRHISNWAGCTRRESRMTRRWLNTSKPSARIPSQTSHTTAWAKFIET